MGFPKQLTQQTLFLLPAFRSELQPGLVCRKAHVFSGGLCPSSCTRSFRYTAIAWSAVMQPGSRRRRCVTSTDVSIIFSEVLRSKLCFLIIFVTVPLWRRMESMWTSSWLGHGCSVGTDGVCVDGIMVGTWMLWAQRNFLAEINNKHDVFGRPTPRNTVNTDAFGASTPVPCFLAPPPPQKKMRQARRFRLRSPKYGAGRRVRGAREQAVGALNKDPKCDPDSNSFRELPNSIEETETPKPWSQRTDMARHKEQVDVARRSGGTSFSGLEFENSTNVR